MHALEKKELDLLQSGPLRIGFHWHRDRFAHSISLRKENRWLPLLASQEGDRGNGWPPSPVLQELQFEEHASGRVALLVGCTTQAHWSLAVGTTETGFCFEVACRRMTADLFICDTVPQTGYRTMVAPAQEGDASGMIRVDDIVIAPLDDSACGDSPDGGAEDPAWRLAIVPKIGEGAQKTVCWRYAVNFHPVDASR